MLRQGLSWLVFIVVLPAASTLGAEAAHGTAEHKESGGIFSGDIFTAVFTLALFVVLLLILRKWGWGPILSSLQKREEHIRHSIQEAETARDDAQKTLDEYRQQLAAAQAQAQEILDQGRRDAVQLASELKETAQEEARNLRLRAEQDIGHAKDQALREICEQSSELTTGLAAKILGRQVTGEDHRRLVQESLNRLQQVVEQD